MADNIDELMQQVGFSKDESSVFLLLNEFETLTALEISRSLEIPRTSVYRYLDNLKDVGLVLELLDGKSRIFKASSPRAFELLVAKHEADLEAYKNATRSIIDVLSKHRKNIVEKPEIRHYGGVEGLKQVTWNSLKAKGTLRIMEISNMSDFLNQNFAEKVRQEFVNRGVKVKEITNQREFGAWTRIEKLYKDLWQCRYISPEILPISSEVLIYNNVYALYGFKKGNIWGVEIHNKDLAKMQKQVFDSFWEIGKKMKVGKGGHARIIK